MSSIRDVAKEAGCSIATVSRVLSADPSFKVSDATKDRVIAAVTKLGYIIPVRQQNRKQIGVVLSITAEKYSDPFFTDILLNIEKECEKLNLAIGCIKTFNELAQPVALQEFIDMDLAGVIFMERVPDVLLMNIMERIPHIVLIDNDEDDYHFDGVGFDHRIANKQAMKCLLNYGYKRIALISGSSPNEPLEDSIRLSTYKSSIRKAGIDFDPEIIKDCEWDLDTAAEQTKELMSLPNPPDAIFAGSDSLASAILGALYSLGIKCPEDIGIIGFNNLEMCNHTVPPLSSISIPTGAIGINSARRLKEMIDGENIGEPRKILFPTNIVLRESLKEQR